MKIALCGSIEFTHQIKQVADSLIELGHKVAIPLTCQSILDGELTMEEFRREKAKSGEGSERKIRDNVIKRYFEIIQRSDAILVLNIEKHGQANYIGPNTFLEMGFAHVLDKPIFLYNDIPESQFKDEILAMQPLLISSDLQRIR